MLRSSPSFSSQVLALCLWLSPNIWSVGTVNLNIPSVTLIITVLISVQFFILYFLSEGDETESQLWVCYSRRYSADVLQSSFCYCLVHSSNLGTAFLGMVLFWKFDLLSCFLFLQRSFLFICISKVTFLII